MDVKLSAVVLLLAAANVLVSSLVVRHALYSHSQKALQILLVWLVPVIGAIVVWQVLRAQKDQSRTSHPHANSYSQEDAHASSLSLLGKSKRKDDANGEGLDD